MMMGIDISALRTQFACHFETAQKNTDDWHFQENPGKVMGVIVTFMTILTCTLLSNNSYLSHLCTSTFMICLPKGIFLLKHNTI